MKELGIEEKAKCYDEALKQVKECIPDENGFITIYPQEIFPELKESEGEKIRKELIEHIKANQGADYVLFKKFSPDDVIAWLENKKEPKDKGEISTSVNVRKKKATGVLGEMIANINPESLQKTKEQMITEVEQQIKGCIGMILTDANERKFEDFGVTLKECLEWLEKQKITPDKEYVFRPLAGDTIEKASEQAVKLEGKVVLAFNGAYIPVDNKTKDEIIAEYYNWVKKQCEQQPESKRKSTNN